MTLTIFTIGIVFGLICFTVGFLIGEYIYKKDLNRFAGENYGLRRDLDALGKIADGNAKEAIVLHEKLAESNIRVGTLQATVHAGESSVIRLQAENEQLIDEANKRSAYNKELIDKLAVVDFEGRKKNLRAKPKKRK